MTVVHIPKYHAHTPHSPPHCPHTLYPTPPPLNHFALYLSIDRFPQLVGFGATNGGLPSGRSRSPGFDVDTPGMTSKPSGMGEGAASNSAAAAFLANATVVTVASSASSGGSGSGGGRVWGAAPGSSGDSPSSGAAAAAASKVNSDMDHAFAGAMLQRSSSAPPMSDHVSLSVDDGLCCATLVVFCSTLVCGFGGLYLPNCVLRRAGELGRTWGCHL